MFSWPKFQQVFSRLFLYRMSFLVVAMFVTLLLLAVSTVNTRDSRPLQLQPIYSTEFSVNYEKTRNSPFQTTPKTLQNLLWKRKCKDNDSDDSIVVEVKNNRIKRESENNNEDCSPPDGAMVFRVSNKTLYLNEVVSIYCNVSSSLFSQSKGLKLEMKFSNGSKGDPHVIERLVPKTESSNGYLEQSWLVNVTTDNVLSYVCRAQLRESNQSMCVSHEVKVVVGQKPIFTNESSPTELVFNIKQSRAEIHCEAWGIPQPEITWWREGLEYQDDTQNSGTEDDSDTKWEVNITKSTLVFLNVGRIIPTDITKEFTCNATNIKGTALQLFQFKVENRSTWTVWGPILGVCTTILVSTLIFYLFKFWKKSKEQEKFIQDIDIFKFGRQDLLRLHETIADLENTVGSGRDLALILPYQKQYEVNEADLFIEKSPKQLGEGYFGVVTHGKYRTKTGEIMDVAIKTLKTWNPSKAKALLDELKILTYVGKHDHVVSLVGAITNIDERKIQVILEYCADGSLDKYLVEKRNEFLDEITNDEICFSVCTTGTENLASSYFRIDYAIKTFDLIRWAYHIACGMQYLSSKKIIHGDLAARNLLLTDTRDLKISDFGLSKKIADTQDQYIPSGNLHDLPWRSVAPEWFKNKILSSATDVWSYGITVWEIFSLAELPYPKFPACTTDFRDAILNGHRNPKPQYANTYIHEILLACWDAEPNQRPTFSDLTKIFLDLLPKNYVKTIDVGVYSLQSKDHIAETLDYILESQMDTFDIPEQGGADGTFFHPENAGLGLIQ